MDKLQAIVLTVLGVAFFITISVISLSENNEVEMAKAGLEECPKSIDSMHTMWIKDCVEYTNKLHEIEKETE